MALVCVLSVFNGFQNVIEGLFSNFDPQIRIESALGKSFSPDSVKVLLGSAHIEHYSFVVQENALLKFKDKQLPVVVKGVDLNYDTLTNISSIMVKGEFSLKQGNFYKAVTGAALAGAIGSGVYLTDPIILYAPKREGKINMMRPDQSFREIIVWPAGTFMVRQEKYDNTMVIVSIDAAQELFGYENEVTSVDIKLKDKVNEKNFIKSCQAALGDSFKVLDRYNQQYDFYRMMAVEKWITYLILSFILMIAAFNIIGSMSMLIIDKKDDIRVLSNLGMRRRDIFRLFMFEGSMISIIGVICGIIFGLILCYLQAEFGLISMGNGGSYIVSSYPVKVMASDIVIILITVITLGVAASVYPAKQVFKDEEI